MNQTRIGSYIARKRREKNLAQEQLAERLGLSNKTVSKWENGKCMPDYGVIEALCQALSITLSELMDGEDAAEDGVRIAGRRTDSRPSAAHAGTGKAEGDPLRSDTDRAWNRLATRFPRPPAAPRCRTSYLGC